MSHRQKHKHKPRHRTHTNKPATAPVPARAVVQPDIGPVNSPVLASIAPLDDAGTAAAVVADPL